MPSQMFSKSSGPGPGFKFAKRSIRVLAGLFFLIADTRPSLIALLCYLSAKIALYA